MRLNDAITALNNENTALEVLTNCQCYFEKIEEISGMLANGVVDNPSECRKVLNDATAIYLALNPLLSLAETEKNNREVLYFHNLKIETEKRGEKFVSASGTVEASAHVATYRRIRNILEGYVESAKMAISTCQSVLKSLSDEMKIIPTQEN